MLASEDADDWTLHGTQENVVLAVQVIGILIHLALLVFLVYNLFIHVRKLNQKPFTIIIFYMAAFVTLVALIVSFSVINNPDAS